MDYIYFRVEYEIPYDMRAVRSIADALVRAVAGNWSEQDGPEFRERVELRELPAWLESADPEKMERNPEEFADEDDIERFTKDVRFLFSPLSSWVARMLVYRKRDRTLGVSMNICDRVRTYDPGFGYDGSVHWPKNRACLLNIYNSLCALFPVRRKSIDPELPE